MAKAAKDKDKDKGKKPEATGARSDAYVMMLFITFAAITTGTVLMYLDFAGGKELGINEDPGYAGQVAPKEPVPTLPKLGEATKVVEPPAGTTDTPMGEPKKDPMMPMGDPKMDPKMDPKVDPKMEPKGM